MRRPKKSFTSPDRMISAMPLVNPVTSGCGMNAMASPNFANPMMMRIRNPATIAVQSPRSGDTPLAIAKAMANGSATIPTMTPALASLRNCARSYVRRVETSLGTNTKPPLKGRPPILCGLET